MALKKVTDPQKISNGRKAVDAYRAAHTQLYLRADKKGIPEAHTPLLDKMKVAHKAQGFNSLQEFFSASELQNIKELGFPDRSALNAELERLRRVPDVAKATEILETLDGKWH